MNKIKFSTVAKEWLDGLPIGNGRLAAMVCAQKSKDILTLNHEWLWRGDTKVPREAFSSAQYLPLVRDLLKKDDSYRATRSADLFFGGYGSGSGIKNNLDYYQFAGNLVFEIDDVVDFNERELDLYRATAYSLRKTTKTNILSEAFCDCTSGVLLLNWKAEDGNSLSGNLSFDKELSQNEKKHISIKSNEIIYHGSFEGGLSYTVNVEIKTDGECIDKEDHIRIENSGYVSALCNIKVSVSSERGKDNCYACLDNYAELLKNHQEKFLSYMSRVDLELGKKSIKNIPMEERMKNLRNGETDTELFEILFNFSRYLMLSSSLCGELPMNLQGKWNGENLPAWNCDYHYDINVQICYWIAECINLPECAQILSDYLIKRMDNAKKSAKNIYGCRGIYFPLADDVWGQCTPESCYYGVWIGAAPWLAQHLWWHYRYSGDMDYLKNSAYKFFKAVAEFYEDYLVEDEDGILQIMPSQSPENRFVEHENALSLKVMGAADLPVSICISSAMDIELAQDALYYAIESAKILNIDNDKIVKWQDMKNRLAKLKISSDGKIVEWDREDRQEMEEGHRHLSHIYGLYPSELLTKEKDEKLYNAAVNSLYERINGYTPGLICGWGEAWVSCMLARIGDKEGFKKKMTETLAVYFTDNLMGLSPHGYEHIKSEYVFQIDGNFGASAAILEALASYWGNTLHLLPCLPDEWETGHLHGFKMQGGHTVNFAWENGVVTELSVIMGYESSAKFEVNGKSIVTSGKCGEEIRII